ncbi:NAD(P)/FAD-dependent oxidoreductase [Bradyrhizobium sp. ARR65]|uniref:SidA/IucD/PvdA family monooxygenase n=1 Tax=Bradyrhizobium sp. ARR65 TaxID=1040989 RepID=UPI0005537389|nr:NAD(P)/FAD-dependent oxidoreductase [Bradyrhizobium sp. ARR65]
MDADHSIDHLTELERRVRFEMECLGYPARQWTIKRNRNGIPVHDVIIVGGGQSGVSIAFRLLRERVSNVRVLDRNPAGHEGPWLTFARMPTLRTPKVVTGPDLGIPSLSPRAWWEARFGERSWQGLNKIPRELWQAYLLWVRKTVGIEVSNEAAVTDIEPLSDGLLAVHARIGGTAQRLLARKIVLATGIEGSGRWAVPAAIAEALPKKCYAHTAEPIDFRALAGKAVAVIGAGASAFDNAAMALEAGASSVELFVRRRHLPAVNPNRWMEFAGFLRHFGDLDDARKWRFMKIIFDMSQPPPQDTFDRCARHENFSIRLGCPIDHVRFESDKILLSHSKATQAFDYLIAGTGFVVDLASRPELARFHDQIACWSDRYRPPSGEEHPPLGSYPYLSANFQFTEKVEGAAPFLAHIFSYTFAAMPSLACSAGISALKFGVDRIADGITRSLFIEDADLHLQSLRNYDETELNIGIEHGAALSRTT